MIIRRGETVLIVRKYERPTEALYRSEESEVPIDDPKRIAREYIRNKLKKELGLVDSSTLTQQSRREKMG